MRRASLRTFLLRLGGAAAPPPTVGRRGKGRGGGADAHNMLSLIHKTHQVETKPGTYSPYYRPSRPRLRQHRLHRGIR